MQKAYLFILLLIVLLVARQEKSYTQWMQTNGPYGGEINLLVAKGDTIFAGTDGSGVFRSMNNGLSWVGLSGGSPRGQICSIALKEGNLFVNTLEGTFLSTDNGTSWKSINNGLTAQWGVCSFAVIGANIFAATTDSGIYRSTDNGAKWTQVNTGLANPAYVDILASNGNNLFAGTGSGFYLSTDYGNNWTCLSELRIIDFQALLVNDSNIFAGGIGIFRSTDSGTNWTSVGLENHYIYSFISCPNGLGGTNIFAGTDTGIVLSTDNGTHWTIMNAGLPRTTVLSLTKNGNNLFAGTWNGVFLSSDNGQHWNIRNSGLTGCRIAILASFPDNLGGNNLYAGMDAGGVQFSTDNGIHWNLSSLQNEYVSSLAYDGTYLLTCTPYGLARSTDNGVTWSYDSQGLTSGVSSFAVLDNKIFATGRGIYISTNEGKNWSRSDTGLSYGWFPLANVITICDTIIVIGYESDAYTAEYSLGSGILYSTDKGISWVTPDSDITADYITILVTQGKNIYAGTLNYGISRSTNSGRSWISVNTGLSDRHVISLVASGKNIFAATGGGVFFSTNEGTEWKQTNSGLLDTNVSSLAVNGENIFAGTQNRGVWRRPLSEMVTDVKESRTVLPNEFTLFQNYPNPFNPTTVINYTLPIKTSVTLKIYDILGRDVETLVDEHQNEGSHSVLFNGSNLASGVYFYRLCAGSFVNTKKLILIK